MKIKVSAFITSKAGEPITSCQDSFKINTANGTFAVSDGVSQSLYSNIWSNILTDEYTKNPDSFFVENESGKTIQTSLCKMFDERFNEMFEQLPEKKKGLVKISKTRTPFSAATFIGLRIDAQNITFDVLGDSVLFYQHSGNLISCCTMPHSDDGKIKFDNSPEYFASDPTKHNGKVKTISVTMKECRFYMMTDAISAWFDNISPDMFENTVGKLNSMKSHSDFQQTVDGLRRSQVLKDDDTTLVIVDIQDDGQEGLNYEMVHIDDINELIVFDLKNQIASLEKEKQIQKETIDELNTSIKSKDSEISILKTLNQNLETEKFQLSNKIKNLEADKGSMKNQFDQERNQLRAETKKIQDLYNAEKDEHGELKSHLLAIFKSIH